MLFCVHVVSTWGIKRKDSYIIHICNGESKNRNPIKSFYHFLLLSRRDDVVEEQYFPVLSFSLFGSISIFVYSVSLFQYSILEEASSDKNENYLSIHIVTFCSRAIQKV